MNASHLSCTYGDYDVDFNAIPQVSQVKLITAGLAHVLGNEVSSAVNAFFRAQAVAQAEAKAGRTLTKDERKSIKATEPTDSEAYLAKATELRKAKVQALLDGTIGESRSVGPKLSPLEAEIAKRVRDEVLAILRNEAIMGSGALKGRKIPDDETEFVVKGESVPFGELKERYASGKHAARIAKEAQAYLDAEAKRLAKLGASANEAADTEALGF